MYKEMTILANVRIPPPDARLISDYLQLLPPGRSSSPGVGGSLSLSCPIRLISQENLPMGAGGW